MNEPYYKSPPFESPPPVVGHMALPWLLGSRWEGIGRHTMELDPQFALRLADTAQAVILVLDLDARILYYNAYLERLSGHPLEQMRGRDYFEAFVPSRDHARIASALENVRRGSRVTSRVTPIMSRSGEEVMLEWSAVALTDDDGAVRAVLAVGHDVSEQLHEAEQRIAAEAELRRSESMLRRAQAIAHIGSFEARPPFLEGDILWSDELYRILGWDPGDPTPSLRTTLRQLLHPDDRSLVVARLRHAAHTLEGFRFDCRVRRTDGTIRFVHLEIEPETAGDKVGWVGVVHDVTVRRELEREIARAQKLEAVGTLTSGIAHDYNNLLMGIIGCLDLAERHSSPDGRARRYLREARAAAKEGASLTQQLLTFARPAGALSRESSLDAAINESARMFRSVLGENVQLELSLAGRRWPIRVDRGQLDQLLMNLVVNARDAMPEGGIFTIRTDEVKLTPDAAARLRVPPGAYVRLRVRDTGTGMDPDTAARIFDPFFTTKQPERGTGLGLATVYGIVRQAGGHIGVDSTRGEGTVITVHLPRARGTGEWQATPAEEHPPLRRGHETVLVVANQPLVRAAVRTQLEPLGYKLVEAESAAAASRIASQPGIEADLLLADAVIDGGSGGEVVERLRSEGLASPVVFMCEHLREVLDEITPTSRVLVKPFTADQLLEQVTRALDRGQADRRRADR